jgi:hypothetical protein
MLSKETTLRSSTSTYVTGKDFKAKKAAKIVETFKADDVKLIFVKHNRKKSKHNVAPNEKIKTIKPEVQFNTSNLSDLKSAFKRRSKSNTVLDIKFNPDRSEKQVKFADEGEKKKLAEITIVPSYAMFYDNVYINDEDNSLQKEKVHCKCGCNIF